MASACVRLGGRAIKPMQSTQPMPNYSTFVPMNLPMKILYTGCLAGLMLWSAGAAGQTSRTMETNITDVTLFTSGAQVFRVGKVQLSGGKNEIVIKKLSSDLDPNSVVVQGRGNFAILGVENKVNYLEIVKDSTQLAEWVKKQGELQRSIARETNLQSGLNKEIAALEAGLVIKSTQQIQTSAQLKDLLDFQRSRLAEISQKMEESNLRLSDLNKEYSRVTLQIQSNGNNQNEKFTELSVTVSATQATEAELMLSYFVGNAGWYPEYDIRLKDITSPLTVKTKARVRQQTKENWKEVHLTLSTGSPNKSGVRPFLPIYYLQRVDYGRKDAAVHGDAYLSNVAPAARTETTLSEVVISNSKSRQKASDYKGTATYAPVVRSEGVNTLNFELKSPYTIPGDGNYHSVEVNETEIPAEYEYQAVPKLDRDVFLIARITDWEKYDLMQGQANIFMEGTFTGKTNLNPGTPGDTLLLSLGRDKSILVKRELVKDFSKTRLLGSDKTVERRVELTIRNTKKVPVQLTIEDQIPVSKNADITVEMVANDGGTLDEETGKLFWKLKPEPAKDQKYRFGYKIKFPKSFQLQLE